MSGTPPSASDGFVLRSRVQIGDPIRTIDDSEGRKIQVITLADCFGEFVGCDDTNPFHVTGAELQDILAALNILTDAVSGGTFQVTVTSTVLPPGASTEAKQDDAITILNDLLTELQNPTAPGGTTDVNVVSTVLPPGAATETTLDALLTELMLKADLSETQPVSVTNQITGFGTETTLLAILSELDEKADKTEVQPVSITGTPPLPSDAATETTLSALLTELMLKADLTETQPVSLASVPLAPDAATETTLAAILADLAMKADLSETQPVSVTSSVLPTGAATDASLAAILAELMLKADLSETQPVSVTNQISGFATQATLAAVLTELMAKADLSETQPVSVTNFPADRATETTLAAILTELMLKANLSETQPISAASLPLPTGAATQTTLAAVLAELTQKTEPSDTQNVNIVSPSPLVIDDADIVQKLCDLLAELELKADLTEIQPVKVCASELPDGAAEEETLNDILVELQLDRTTIKKFDETDVNCVYLGEALSGTSDSDPSWSIRKITISGPLTDILRADGGSFTQVWDDRAILTYA